VVIIKSKTRDDYTQLNENPWLDEVAGARPN